MNPDERMWNADTLEQKYYKWLTGMVPSWRDSHSMLLRQLYETPFAVRMEQDENRAADGLSLRIRFLYERHISPSRKPELMQRPCGILEVMLALALGCEEEYLFDGSDDDPISRWFGPMINSLGLASCTDSSYDADLVNEAAYRFLNRAYQPDGLGGLFYIPGCDHDLRKTELWTQLMIWINKYKGGTGHD